jgi:molybdopterin/thiamine biosynthesis adenylyltransferase
MLPNRNFADVPPRVSDFDERYSRQLLFYGIGKAGQTKLSASSVAIVGCGATGSAIASLMGRAGVGFIRIIDRDFVESSNLQRQNLFDEADAAESAPKAIAASRKILAFNSKIAVEPLVTDVTPENIEESLARMQLIIDGTDNFETRYLVNDFAVANAVPWIYTAAVGSQAATMNILPGETACLACIFPKLPAGAIESCETAGVLNSAVNFAASIAATEALKIIIGASADLRRTLLSFDVWTNQRAEISTRRPVSSCRVCGLRDFVYLNGTKKAQITLCGRNSVQIHERHRSLDLAEVGRSLSRLGTVRQTEFVLKFWIDSYELTLFPDGRAIIKGTVDKSLAKSLYTRYVGN